MFTNSLGAELRRVLPPESVQDEVPAAYLADAARLRVDARADILVRPGTAKEVAETMSWCYEHDVPITPRGGGTGLAGGALPVSGGVLISFERLTALRSFEPLAWRIEVEAGMKTADLHRLARENGLLFAPDPGAAEQSQVGGNIATNAGGPHAFKYGVTKDWVTGLEAVIPPGHLVPMGGVVRKDVAGLDLKSLLIGSEGVLGLITAASLKLLPAPEQSRAVTAFFSDLQGGCRAIELIVGSGMRPAALDFIEGLALAAVAGTYPGDMPPEASFAVLADVDGSPMEVDRQARELEETLNEGALSVDSGIDPRSLWGWRDSSSGAVAAREGAKLSEDVSVPLECLAELIEQTGRIGERFDLPACSWGHGGDGNVHASFLFPADVDSARLRAEAAVEELFVEVGRLGGSISGEHGVGLAKRPFLEASMDPRSLELQREIKDLFDPKGLLNPGKAI